MLLTGWCEILFGWVFSLRNREGEAPAELAVEITQSHEDTKDTMNVTLFFESLCLRIEKLQARQEPRPPVNECQLTINHMPLSQQRPHHIPVHIGQAITTALVLVGQAFVVNSK